MPAAVDHLIWTEDVELPGRTSRGQTIPMSTTQTIEEQGGSWVVTGTAKLPTGDAVVTSELQP